MSLLVHLFYYKNYKAFLSERFLNKIREMINNCDAYTFINFG